MRVFVSLSVVLGACLHLVTANGQVYGQWTVTFDGYPLLPPGWRVGVSEYREQYMRFTGIDGALFGRTGGPPESTWWPSNGGAYICAGFGDSLAVSSLSGQPFSLVSVDLAEWSTSYSAPLTVPFIGYRSDGSTVTTEFVTDGIMDGAGPLNDFQTFYFDSAFANLVRVELPTYGWNMDNLTISTIPEPGTGALIILGAVVLRLRRSLPRTSTPIPRHPRSAVPCPLS